MERYIAGAVSVFSDEKFRIPTRAQRLFIIIDAHS